MPNNEQLSSRFNNLADSIDVGNTSVALSEVTATGAARNRRRNVVGGTLAVAALVAGGVAISNVVGDGDAGSVAINGPADTTATEPTTTAVGPAPVGTDATTAAASPIPVSDSATVVSAASVSGPAIAVDSYPQVVPWGEGFLAISRTYTSPPFPSEVPEELQALFPQSVIDLFADQSPATVDDAMVILEEAGLMQEVENIYVDNPELGDFFFGAPGDVAVDVQYSADGTNWEPVDFALPADGADFGELQSDGERLTVVLTPSYGPGTSPVQAARLASTVDLVNWETIEVPIPAAISDLPGLFEVGVYPQAVAVHGDVVVASVSTWADVNVEQFVSDDIRQRMDNEGYGSSWNADGYLLELGGEFGGVASTTVIDEVAEGDDADAPADTGAIPADSGAIEAGPAVSITITWDELGITKADADQLNQGQSALMRGTWGGALEVVTGPNVWSLVASNDGFYGSAEDGLLFSTDGLQWSEVALPDGVRYVDALISTPDGIALLSSNDGGTVLVTANGPDGNWQRVELPNAPEYFNSFSGNSASGAIVVDASEAYFGPSVDIVIEVDGYVATLKQAEARMTLTVVDGDGAVVVEGSHSMLSASEPEFWSFNRDGDIDVIDPATGALVVTLPADALDAAYEEAYEEVDEQPEFEPWVLAALEGNRWLFEPLASSQSADGQFMGPGEAATNGEIVVVATGDGWQVFDPS